MAAWYSLQPGGVLGAIPVLGALALGAQRMLPMIQVIYQGWAQYSIYKGSLQDLIALLDVPSERITGVLPANVEPFERSIQLDDVTFRYNPGGAAALAQVNLTIAKGERVGFIGKTGSGKSTLVDVIMGLLPPTEGNLCVDGRPMNPDAIGNWKAQIAHVPQAIFLSDDSIAANIAFGVPEAEQDEQRVREAADRAGLGDFLDSLPRGLETSVGERGIRLSGGQRQRIGIARALYKRATVLVLDEATSALDNETEASVMESVARLGPDLTVILIAHRLSTVSGCDRIYRLDGGRIVAEGSVAAVIG
jgi:ATP-binding cassette subfamily B protein